MHFTNLQPTFVAFVCNDLIVKVSVQTLIIEEPTFLNTQRSGLLVYSRDPGERILTRDLPVRCKTGFLAQIHQTIEDSTYHNYNLRNGLNDVNDGALSVNMATIDNDDLFSCD